MMRNPLSNSSYLPKSISLAKLIDAFDCQSDTLFFYVNKKTGAIVSLTQEEVDESESGEAKEINEVHKILQSEDYIPLPDAWEIDRYEMMEDFINSLDEPEMQMALSHAIEGSGAFGRFRSLITAYHIQDRWFQFQRHRLEEMAIEWSQEHNLKLDT